MRTKFLCEWGILDLDEEPSLAHLGEDVLTVIVRDRFLASFENVHGDE